MGAVMADRKARLLELIAADREAETLDEMTQRMTGAVSVDGGRLYEGLPDICRAWDVPYGQVLQWLMKDADRYEIYLKALEVQAHSMVSETVRLADGASPDAVSKASLQINTRFRVAKHHAPALYAEKVEVKHSGTVTFSHALQGMAARRLAAKGAGVESAGEVIDVTPERVVGTEDGPVL